MPLSVVEERAREHFERVTADHEMTILRHDGLYRHLRFAEPGTLIYSYELVTWPGHLAINGDLDSGYTFSRIEDMISFFGRGPGINPSYWREKITCIAAREGVREYSQESLGFQVQDHAFHIGDTTDVSKGRFLDAWEKACSDRFDVTTEHGAHEALREFSCDGYGFGPDTWEWDLRGWNHSYLLCCYAIRAGVDRYLGR